MRGRLRIAWLWVACLVGACTSAAEPLDPDGPWHALAQRPCPEENFLTWENFGDPFFRSWCTGCHASTLSEESRREAPLELNFDSLDGVRSNIDLIWLRAADENQTMPPAGGPPHPERELLGEWLACGARGHALP